MRVRIHVLYYLESEPLKNAIIKYKKDNNHVFNQPEPYSPRYIDLDPKPVQYNYYELLPVDLWTYLPPDPTGLDFRLYLSFFQHIIFNLPTNTSND